MAYQMNQIKLLSWKTVYGDYENKHNCVIDGYDFRRLPDTDIDASLLLVWCNDESTEFDK